MDLDNIHLLKKDPNGQFVLNKDNNKLLLFTDGSIGIKYEDNNIIGTIRDATYVAAINENDNSYLFSNNPRDVIKDDNIFNTDMYFYMRKYNNIYIYDGGLRIDYKVIYNSMNKLPKSLEEKCDLTLNELLNYNESRVDKYIISKLLIEKEKEGIITHEFNVIRPEDLIVCENISIELKKMLLSYNDRHDDKINTIVGDKYQYIYLKDNLFNKLKEYGFILKEEDNKLIISILEKDLIEKINCLLNDDKEKEYEKTLTYMNK